MLIHTDAAQVSKIPHTVLMVGAPVRLDWLFSAVLKRGVYYVEGDLRPKVKTRMGQRQIQAGLVKLEYVGEAPTPPIVVAEIIPESSVPTEILQPELEVSDSEPIVVLDDTAPKKKGRKAKPVVEAEPDPTLPVYEENSTTPVSEVTSDQAG